MNNILLLFLLAALAGSCSRERPERLLDSLSMNPQKPLVLVLKHRADEYGGELSAHVAKSLDYTKIPYQSVDLGIISDSLEIPSSVKTIVATSYLVSEMDQQEITKLVAFVSKGNTIVFCGPVAYDNFAFLQGIKPQSGYDMDSTSTGMHLYKNIFPGMAGKTFDPPLAQPHKGLTRNMFAEDVEVIASAAGNPEFPLILSNSIGLGEVLTLNSQALDDKFYRGVMFSMILKGLEAIPYNIANISTIFLDDFPAPLYKEKLRPIAQEYNMTHAQFVSKVWWPDMKALADTFDINYTALTAFNYNANVVPPFDFNEWLNGEVTVQGERVNGSIYIGRDVRDSEHELGFHGYNHYSLWLEDWPNQNFMISSLQAARKRWKVDNLGDFPVTYVPPTNLIDSTGIQALIRGMPSIRYMSSLYIGNLQDGGGREFDPDPFAPEQLFDYPRITSGFNINSNSLYYQHGMQLVTGIWNHFIHPDDVFQILQRTEDEYRSRNPLGLGWKTHPTYGYGLYQLFEQRLEYTQSQYPLNQYLSAQEGGSYAEDWRNRISRYTQEEMKIKVESFFKPGYKPKSNIPKKHWFMYVSQQKVREIDPFLEVQNLDFSRSELWDGFLYQFHSERESFQIPVIVPSYYHKADSISSIVASATTRFEEYHTPQNPEVAALTQGEWRDTRLEDALRALRKNPGSLRLQDKAIELCVEFGQVRQAIDILESRILTYGVWKDVDFERLFTYYGWEGMQDSAEEFLEALWNKYGSQDVIEIKNMAVQLLGLYGQEFNQRWLQRELKLNPENREKLLAYTKTIENQQNWPQVKNELLRLIDLDPDSDSLYAYTLQRSMWYESPDSTLALVERFPVSVQSQLRPFAYNIALMYAYNQGNYSRALYWADKAPGFNIRTKLEWLAELNLYTRFLELATKELEVHPENDSLHSFIGTRLYYEGFRDKAMEIMYPLFEDSTDAAGEAQTLMQNEISFLEYENKKRLYKQYPAFFSEDKQEELKEKNRWQEGWKLSANGEYRDDNFDNTFIRGGISAQFGNRLKQTHTVKIEDLFFSDQVNLNTVSSTYYGAGYEYQYKSEDQQLQLRAGSGFLYGEEGFIPEVLAGASYSHDSAFTSGQLNFSSVLTNTAIRNNYYRLQFQFYREDYWGRGKVSTTFSGGSKYYTNNVLQYEGLGRVYLQAFDDEIRFRTLGELGYSDATRSYLSGIPYYTPDNYFSQGIGFDVQYRNPDSFDYQTRLQVEVVGKHELEEGFFITGNAQLEHKFNNFWQLNVGTEASTSRIYRSNRIFITISHYFPAKLN